MNMDDPTRYAFDGDNDGAELVWPVEAISVIDGDPDNAGRGAGYKGAIEVDGQKFELYGASCGAPHCMCAWRAKRF